MRMPSRNFRGGKSLGGGGESYGFVREGKGLFSMWCCVLSQNFCWASYKLLLPPPLSTIVSFIVMHVVMPLAYNINCPIIYLKNHHDCVLQNQEPPDGKYCRIRSWKPLGTFTVCINNKTLITYATN